MTGSRTAEVEVNPLEGSAEDWRDQALCAQTDPEAFFPDRGGSPLEAKRICNRCEVTAECLFYSLTVPPTPVGVWGGLTERERRRLKRRAVAG